MAQNVIFLYLVTEKFCLPIGFAFYTPDPLWNDWVRENNRLKKQGVPKNERPKEPKRTHKKKHELAIELMKSFKAQAPWFRAVAVLADAFYGHCEFIDGTEHLWPNAQVISQLRKNQKIACCNGKWTSFADASCKQFQEKQPSCESIDHLDRCRVSSQSKPGGFYRKRAANAKPRADAGGLVDAGTPYRYGHIGGDQSRKRRMIEQTPPYGAVVAAANFFDQRAD